MHSIENNIEPIVGLEPKQLIYFHTRVIDRVTATIMLINDNVINTLRTIILNDASFKGNLIEI